MALNIYIGDYKPDNLTYIHDVDSFFERMRIKDNDFSRRVIMEIDMGNYIESDMFIDRFGRGLYIGCLSTSSKILLALNQYPNYLINATEIGSNAIDLILDIPDANVYFQHSYIEFNNDVKEVYLNDKLYTSCDDLNMAISYLEDQ